MAYEIIWLDEARKSLEAEMEYVFSNFGLQRLDSMRESGLFFALRAQLVFYQELENERIFFAADAADFEFIRIIRMVCCANG